MFCKFCFSNVIVCSASSVFHIYPTSHLSLQVHMCSCHRMYDQVCFYAATCCPRICNCKPHTHSLRLHCQSQWQPTNPAKDMANGTQHGPREGIAQPGRALHQMRRNAHGRALNQMMRFGPSMICRTDAEEVDSRAQVLSPHNHVTLNSQDQLVCL